MQGRNLRYRCAYATSRNANVRASAPRERSPGTPLGTLECLLVATKGITARTSMVFSHLRHQHRRSRLSRTSKGPPLQGSGRWLYCHRPGSSLPLETNYRARMRDQALDQIHARAKLGKVAVFQRSSLRAARLDRYC